MHPSRTLAGVLGATISDHEVLVFVIVSAIHCPGFILRLYAATLRLHDDPDFSSASLVQRLIVYLVSGVQRSIRKASLSSELVRLQELEE